MEETIKGLYEIVQSRKDNAGEGSYTAYLFEQGLDKILKKVGEECVEVVIASKNLEAATGDKSKEIEDFNNEICDLVYHLLVLMADRDISLEGPQRILEKRRQKSGNLKETKIVDKNT